MKHPGYFDYVLMTLLNVLSVIFHPCFCELTPQAVASMVEECCKFVDQTPDIETKLKFIDTLRTVTEGKVRLAVRLYNEP